MIGRPDAGDVGTRPLIDRLTLRLVIIGLVIVAMFFALFSRLWFLQVLASDEFEGLARNNVTRRVETEPPRGRILDRNGEVLVDNRFSLSVTLERSLLDRPSRKATVLRRLSHLLDVPRKEFRRRIDDGTVSPYKPIALANDVPREAVFRIRENPEDFPGVGTPMLPIRSYPHGRLAAQVLGYVGEISEEQLVSDYFARSERPYAAGDIVGKVGLERSYDRILRGTPGVTRVIVNSRNAVTDGSVVRGEEPGRDLITSLDLDIQRATERALSTGIRAARRAGYKAPDGGVVVLDPGTGEVVAMASYPTYEPALLADGLSEAEFASLGQATATGNDDAMLNRPIQAQVPPGSTFKPVTAGAALTYLPEVTVSSRLPCRGSETFGTGTGGVTFHNWTSQDFGYIDFARSLEISCDTFYYRLGWSLEERFGAALGDGSERFQRYMRRAGFGSPTGVDIPFETAGVVPDRRWLNDYCSRSKEEGCGYGWLPGYTVNMAIGQGSLAVSPLQMAVTYSALANGGRVLEPRIATGVGRPSSSAEGDEQILRRFDTRVAARLPLDSAELGAMRRGLRDVVMGPGGTARGAFSGFPLDRIPVAGKTGTAQIGSVDSGENYAWFVGYAPADDPQYLIAAYIHRAGHGGESAAPVVRQIFERIFEVDRDPEAGFHDGADRST